MSRHKIPADGVLDNEALEILGPEVGSDKKTSEVKGSGRFFFALAKILVDVIDDELQVSDSQKCAGKKVDPVKRVARVATSAVSKGLIAQERLGSSSGSDTALTGLGIGGGAAALIAVLVFL
jgi:hypothetical protein